MFFSEIENGFKKKEVIYFLDKHHTQRNLTRFEFKKYLGKYLMFHRVL
jgi:hypothetical protein